MKYCPAKFVPKTEGKLSQVNLLSFKWDSSLYERKPFSMELPEFPENVVNTLKDDSIDFHPSLCACHMFMDTWWREDFVKC